MIKFDLEGSYLTKVLWIALSTSFSLKGDWKTNSALFYLTTEIL